MSTSTLSRYLLGKKTEFLRDNGRGWTIVTGNEAGDLDTIASSIGYAWYRSHTEAQNTGRKAVALMPQPRSDFYLRAENIHALATAGVHDPFDELLCPEDLPPDHKCTDYALVDHNSMDNSSPNTRVVAVIDHHEDEGKYHDTASPRIIEPAGSCTSLVTRLLMSGSGHTSLPRDLVGLLLSAIAIDTQALKKGGKALEVDRVAAAWLLGRVNLTEPTSHVGEIRTTKMPTDTDLSVQQGIIGHDGLRNLADTLNSKKQAVSHLSTRDLLRRDSKKYTLKLSPFLNQENGGIIQVELATVPLPLLAFFNSGSTAVLTATTSWMDERGLIILGVLTTYRSKKDKGRREQLWIVRASGAPQQQRLAQALFDGLEAEASLALKRRGFTRYGLGGGGDTTGNDEDGDDDTSSHDGSTGEQAANAVSDSPFGPTFIARVYKQNNTHATRKQVAPLLKRILEG
ncbi:DHH phosphoesterase [Pisolithus marmoratus]|nr:DHH phosphoesterase [Pisolithus marmoratus]